MKKLPILAGLMAAAGIGSAAAAGFSGSTDPSTFTIANIGTLTGGSPSPGLAVFSPSLLVMVGSDSTSPSPADLTPGCNGGVYSTLASPCQLQVTTALTGTFAFDWSYVTADPDGPAGDIFGVLLDGQRIALSDLGGPTAQTGHGSFTALSSFGWFVNCTDCIGGFATATVSGLQVTAVPEPAALGLMLAGLAGIGVWKGSRRVLHQRPV